MNIAGIKKYDIADGFGVRVGVYVSGCTRRCEGCHNPQAWDFDFGEFFDDVLTLEIIKAIDKPWCSGLSILGGEPLEPKNLEGVRDLIESVKSQFSKNTDEKKDIWLYTGYYIDSPVITEYQKDILRLVDYVVDGPYIHRLRDPGLAFRGSSNQRILSKEEILRIIGEGEKKT